MVDAVIRVQERCGLFRIFASASLVAGALEALNKRQLWQDNIQMTSQKYYPYVAQELYSLRSLRSSLAALRVASTTFWATPSVLGLALCLPLVLS